MKPTDVQVAGVDLYFIQIQARIPLKFGPETVTQVTCARARVRVVDRQGRMAEGWGETPLSVTWVWPSSISYDARNERLQAFCREVAAAWLLAETWGHPIEIGYDFQEQILPQLLRKDHAKGGMAEELPWLGALVCSSLFDIALHDAYGCLHGRPVYQMYTGEYMERDLAAFIAPANSQIDFGGQYPENFLARTVPMELPAWHLVGGLDLLDLEELTGKEPRDGYPVLLREWIERDGLNCLKVKLRGNDRQWDEERLVKVGQIGVEKGVDWLSADFNCTVQDPAYVNDILDKIRSDHPRIYGMILYVEQPFPYDLEKYAIDAHSVSARKPLFLDESAHDWKLIRLGRDLGWSGVALKTCKTQTGALLSLCWAKAHGMSLMVQDLSNPMLAQIPHLLLAAYAETIMGVETNSMQFYPAASLCEAAVHPGLYQRVKGKVDLRTIQGSGFGYRIERINRPLPSRAFSAER